MKQTLYITLGIILFCSNISLNYAQTINNRLTAYYPFNGNANSVNVNSIISNNAPQEITWIETQPEGNNIDSWCSISMSSDGTKILAGANTLGATGVGGLYISSNYGKSWYPVYPAGNNTINWYSNAMSADGSRMIVTSAGVTDGNGKLYISKDGGNTWNETQPAGNVTRNWAKAAMNSDGSRIVAGIGGGRLYISTNGGDSWNETQPAGNTDLFWRSISISADGSKIIAGVGGGRLYISSNGGNSWIETQPAGNNDAVWYTISMSSDGSKIIAGNQYERLYISTDGGSSWTAQQFSGNSYVNWATTSMSSDGSKMIAGSCGGRLYISLDGGINWTETQPAGNSNLKWLATAMSSDGNTMIAGVNDGKVYMVRPQFAVPAIAVTSPIGNETWQAGTQHNITWTSSGVDNVKIEYTTNNGNNWNTILASTPANAGSYSWTVPNSASVNCKVRISDASSNEITDVSDGTFTVTMPTYSEWKIFNPSNSIVPTSTFVWPIVFSTNGTMWVGTGGGLLRYNGTWKQYNVPEGLKTPIVWTLAVDNADNIWIGGYQGGLSKYDGTKFTTFNTSNSGLPDSMITSIIIDGSGNKWIGTSKGLAKFDGTNWNVYNTSNSGLPNNYIQTVAIDVNNVLWVGTYGSGLAKFDGSNWTVYNYSNSGLKSDYITFISFDGSGNKWIGTNGGLYKFDGVNWSEYNTSNSSLPDNGITSIAVSKNGKIWVGTQGGLVEIDGSTWTVFKKDNSSLPDNYVYSVVIDNSGNKWIGTQQGGLAEYKDEAPAASIQVTKPNGGEVWLAGTQQVITWTSSGVDNVKIEYTTDNGNNWHTIITSTPANANSYVWSNIPNTPSDQCKLRISAIANNSVYDESDLPFKIKYLQPLVQVVSPNGGEIFSTGQTKRINFLSNNVSNVKIDYSTDGGKTWLAVANCANDPLDYATKAYDWTIPNTASDKCLLRILNSYDFSVGDTSDSFFSISSGRYLKITSPNGGETWQAGTQQNITWTTSGISNLKIEYSLDNDSTGWQTIAANIPASSGSYSWLVCNTPSTHCKIKISDADVLTFFDLSDNLFTIFEISNSNWKVFNTANTSLPGNSVTAIAVEGNNDKWVGTVGGLAKYNSNTWEIFKNENSVQLYNGVVSIGIEGNGNKWIGTNTSGLAKFDGNNWVIYNTVNSGLSNDLVQAITFDKDGNKWFGTNNGGLVKYDGNSWSVYKKSNSGMPDNDVISLTIDNNGDKLVGTIAGLAKFDGNTWTVFNKSNSSLPGNYIASIAIDRNGDKWIGTDGGLVKYDGNNWTIFNDNNSAIPKTLVSSIAVDANGNKWFGSLNGLSKYDGSKWETYTTSNSSLPSNDIRSLAIDGTGNIWIGTNGGGLAVFNGNGSPSKSVSVLLPNGGETWQAGTQQNITWTSNGVDNVKIEYTTDNGVNWTTIIASTPASSGSYSWTVPNSASVNCKIRISDAGDAAINDISDQTFTISHVVSPAVITLTSPNGGNVLTVGSQKTITWSSSNVANVKIECMGNNNNVLHTISASTPASAGSFNWMIKNTPSSSCKIRVTDLSNSSVYDESDNVFGINYPSSISVSVSKDFGDAKVISNYRMIGLPGAINIPVASVLNGTYPNDWKAGWDNGAASDYIVKYDQSSNFNFIPGKAFWILSSKPLNYTGVQSSVGLQLEDGIYSIPLHIGWNLISSPFDKQISWSDVQRLNNIPSGDQLYDFTGSYSTTTVFAPYKGYYFYNRNNLTELQLPYVSNPGTISKVNKTLSKTVQAEQITLMMMKDEEEKASVSIKFDDSTKAGLDDEDMFYPPGDFEEMSIRLKNDKLETEYKYLKEESRPMENDGNEFNLEIKNETTGAIELKSNIINIEGEIFLMDSHGNLYDLKKNIPVEISSSSKQPANYKVLIGTMEYIKQKQQEVLPKKYELLQNYPNPFNNATVITYQIPESGNVELKIFDVLGREVKTIVNEEKEAGYYQINFDAKQLSSGIYFYRISSGNFNQTNKMILQK